MANGTARYVLLTGREEPPLERCMLRAGPVTAELEGIDLRYIRIGDVEIVRRLFAAIRDAAWGTVPPQVGAVEVDAGEREFHVSFEAYHEADDLRFRWNGELIGRESGAIECRMTGKAESDFQYCRIGFCVLHPRENAGRPYRARTPDGEISGDLPDPIGAQRIENGKLYPLFPSYETLEIDVADGLPVRFEFEGDLFEMEDQRNWTDASFKTYSTPLALGFPHGAANGEAIVQVVRIGFPAGAGGEPSVRLELGEPSRRFLPAIGLGLGSHGEPLNERESDLILELRPDHLRVDLDFAAGWRAELERAASAAIATGAGLELALHLGEAPEEELTAVAEALPASQARVGRILLLHEGEAVTDSKWVRLAREKLSSVAPDAQLCGGTDLWFTELNRSRPELDGLDAVFYSIAATVHADDDLSVAETPAAQGDTVRSAQALAEGLAVVVSPVTIRPRSWPFGELEGYRGLPFQVDPRQCALFGAAWTVASLKHLVEAGASSITYFETTGWRGVMERESGSPQPETFRSAPGKVFPLYHVLADAGEWKGEALVRPSRSSDPLTVDALVVQAEGGPRILVANLTADPQRCSIGPLDGPRVSLRVLDEGTVARAVDEPEAFREERQVRDVDGGRLELDLAPYAVVRVDPA